ncbi:MAG: acyl-CoA dehydrogenase family protein [Candidatus Hodarchaeota archaeon]
MNEFYNRNILEKIIDDDILDNMALQNVYSALNETLFPFLNDEEKAFIEELEQFCVKLEPTIDLEKDVYVLFPKLGEKGYLQRMNPWKNFTKAGMKYEVLLGLILAICDAELDLARLASGILAGNPCYHHNDGKDAVLKAMDELFAGTKVGCIGITEPSRGSDAVNMQTICTKVDDGVRFSGEKVFTTNGAKADYWVAYGVYNTANPRGSMVQALISRDMGITTKRLGIWSVPRVHIAHTFFNDCIVPNDYILGDDGKGYKNLFEGLTPERISITGSAMGICWGNLIRSMLYCDQRVQFGKQISKYQGVSFINGDLFAKLMAGTILALDLAGFYDENILDLERKGKRPSKTAEKTASSQAAMAKYYLTKLSHEISYEVQQAMGGISVTDNLKVDRATDVSKIQEVIGGTRNVMLLLITGAIKRTVRGILK